MSYLKQAETIRTRAPLCFDIVERFVKEGVLFEEGNDFYSLTDKGKTLAKSMGGSSQT